jgi:hypothetical protein
MASCLVRPCACSVFRPPRSVGQDGPLGHPESGPDRVRAEVGWSVGHRGPSAFSGIFAGRDFGGRVNGLVRGLASE